MGDEKGKDAAQEAISEAYKEICQNIRITDEISFRLLGAVPLAATVGSGILTVADKGWLLDGSYTALGVIAIWLLGSLITFGLFRWELRNIQRCKWLISRAAHAEARLYADDERLRQFSGMASRGDLDADRIRGIRVASLLDRPWGKTQAEKVIYGAAMAMWLVPIAVALHRLAR